MTYLQGFIQSPMMDYFEVQEALNPEADFNIQFALQPSNNLTPIYEGDVYYRIKFPHKSEQRPQRNLVLELFSTAKSGTGKSTVAVGEGYKAMLLNYPNLDPVKYVENFVHFTLSEFKEKVKEYHEPASFHITDETRRSEALGVGSTAFISKVSDIVSVCRAKGLSVIRIMPSEARHQTINPHYRIDVNKINFKSETNLSLIQDNNLNYRGRIITKRPPIKELWKRYEEKKMEFVEATLDDVSDTRLGVYEKMAKELSEHKDYSIKKKMNEKIWLSMQLFGSETPKNLLKIIISRADVLFQQRE